MKKILMVLEGEFPPDNRVEKEMLSLKENGYIVHLACYTKLNKPLFENFNDFEVYRWNITKLMYKGSAACLVLPFYFKKWQTFLINLCDKNNYDFIHVHDLPLSKVGYRLKKKYKLKLICDQHEYYSNWIVHTAHYNTFSGKIIKLLSNWRGYERKYLKKADLVITVEQPLKDCYINEVGLSPNTIISVPNTPSIKNFNKNNIDQNIINKYKSNFVLFYAGGIDRLRGLELVIKTLKILRGGINNLKFVVVGKESKGFDIKQIAINYSVEDLLDFVGWIPHKEIASYIAASKIGVHTPQGNREEVHNTIATKIYQYTAMEIPIIVSNVKMMREFVNNYNVGYAVENENDFATIVKELHDNNSKWLELSKNCSKIKDKFVWEKTSQNLIDFYNKM